MYLMWEKITFLRNFGELIWPHKTLLYKSSMLQAVM